MFGVGVAMMLVVVANRLWKVQSWEEAFILVLVEEREAAEWDNEEEFLSLGQWSKKKLPKRAKKARVSSRMESGSGTMWK
ncbi:hypothetical protein M5689_013387 [Euphorbia peplus]|nr:hypothetical protein M5689_013387 [Euphorbia peplus]